MTEVQRARERLEAQVYKWAGVAYPPDYSDGPQLDRMWLRRLVDNIVEAVRVETPPF